MRTVNGWLLPSGITLFSAAIASWASSRLLNLFWLNAKHRKLLQFHAFYAQKFDAFFVSNDFCLPDESNTAWFTAHFIFQNVLLNDITVFAENRFNLIFGNGPWQICHIQICIFDIFARWSRI